jgi:Holin of 3TMs, for gene-transfer release
MAIWDLVAGPIIGIINKLIPDKTAAAAAVAQLQQLQAQGTLSEELEQLKAITTAQSDINKVEAASSSVFVAGWRPGIGWVCALALASQYIARPLVLWGFSIAHQPMPALPGIDDNLWQLMFAMLGLGTLRTAEKFKGVQGNH